MDAVRGGRRRRTHSDEFKAQAVRECERPGVSMAAVALSHGINANLLRRWVLMAAQSAATARLGRAMARPTGEGFVALSMPAVEPSQATIRIDVQRGSMTITVSWPVGAAPACAAWLRELLR